MSETRVVVLEHFLVGCRPSAVPSLFVTCLGPRSPLAVTLVFNRVVDLEQFLVGCRPSAVPSLFFTCLGPRSPLAATLVPALELYLSELLRFFCELFVRPRGITTLNGTLVPVPADIK